MKVVAILYVLYILRFGECVNQVDSPGTKISLNITQIDSSRINVTNKTLYGVKTLVLEGKNGVSIGSVTKGGQCLWKDTDGLKFSAVKQFSKSGHQSILSLHLVDVNKNQVEKFFVNDEDWREIQMYEFQERSEAMKRGVAASKSKEGALDINNVDFARVNVNERNKDGTIHRQLTPKGKFFTSVSDLSRPLWSSKRAEKSPRVSLDIKGNLMLLTVTIVGGRTPEVYFENNGTGQWWKNITKEEFNANLEKMNATNVQEADKSKGKPTEAAGTKVEQLGPDPTLDLDMAYPGVVVNKGKTGKLSYTSYILKDSGFFKKVLDKGLNIWAGNDYERCSVVNIYKKGVYAYLTLRVMKGPNSEFICFRRDGDKWQRITQEELDSNLDSDAEEDKSKAGIMTSSPYLMALQFLVVVYFTN